MDSITQFVLGAAVSTACLGNKIGPRKAALMGGLLGTLPDLDVFIPFDDPIDSFVYHRGWTHSVFVHALAAPVIGEVLIRVFKGLRDHRWLTWATVFLVLSTHAMIDAMTVYGTRIFWPLYPEPVGVGSVFIIDPFYSVPLLVVVIYALCKKNWTTRLRNWVAGALIFTTAYMGLSAVLQQYVQWQARIVFQKDENPPEKVYAIAAPFNILLWKVIGLHDDRYENLYYSLLDGETAPDIYEHARHPELSACLSETPAFKKLQWFSRGYFRTQLVGDKVVVSDLRMGLTPGYAFRFEIGQLGENGIEPIPPQRQAGRGNIDANDWAWFWDRLQGRASTRLAETRSGSLTHASAPAVCNVAGSASG